MIANGKKPRRSKTRITPCGFEHDMDPFFMGLGAAEFTPADPAAWFEAACAARVSFCRSGGKISFKSETRGDPARDFLKGLLVGTAGGTEALNDWMAARGFEVIEDGA